jgi:hydrogenase maturation protease
MNLAQVDKIAKAVLYEGYMLYPYRPSSVKNQQRWNFGVLYPRAYSEAQDCADAWSMQTECLVQGNAATLLEARVRFLQLRTRTEPAVGGAMGDALAHGWQEATERDVSLSGLAIGAICAGVEVRRFEFPIETKDISEGDSESAAANPGQSGLVGEVELTAERREENLFKIRVRVRNITATGVARDMTRDRALERSLVSCHTVLGVEGGEFISLLEPPAEWQQAAAQCQNVGAWPVLVGEEGQHDTLLASPIILYDYPKIAPESAGDLFDGTEIDEILSLRILTLTDDEKREIQQSDERARQILERTEKLPAEQFMKLHGAVRSLRPLKESDL